MSDLLEQLLAESKPSEDNALEAARKAFDAAFERVKTFAKCIPDDNEDLAEEKRDWTIEWDGSLKRLWEAMAAARKLGVEVAIDKPVLLQFKGLKDTSTRWKEEAQFKKTAVDVHRGSLVAAPVVPPIVGTTGSASASQGSSRREVSLMTRTEQNQGEGARDDMQETALNCKQAEPEAVQQDIPCDRCMTAAVPCLGGPGRACNRCMSVSQRCTKSSGRGGPRLKRKREAAGDAEQAPEASKTLKIKLVQKRRVSSPPKDAQDDNDEVEVIETPSANSKGKQKAQPSKSTRSSKPSAVATVKNPTTQPKPSKPSVTATPPPEKPNSTTGLPRDLVKTLGELESLALIASAEVKHAQAETKKAEATLDMILSEIRLFRTKNDA